MAEEQNMTRYKNESKFHLSKSSYKGQTAMIKMSFRQACTEIINYWLWTL